MDTPDPIVHDPIKISVETGQLVCRPGSMRVHDKDVVKWEAADLEQWAVIFGPDSPFDKRVLTPADPTTTVKANRPGDFHRHKYVVLAVTNGKVSIKDPDLIVDE